MTSVDIIAEFIRGRPALEAEIRSFMSDPFKAPEQLAGFVGSVVMSQGDLTVEEREGLERLHAPGMDKVDWYAVAVLFGAPEVP